MSATLHLRVCEAQQIDEGLCGHPLKHCVWPVYSFENDKFSHDSSHQTIIHRCAIPVPMKQQATLQQRLSTSLPTRNCSSDDNDSSPENFFVSFVLFFILPFLLTIN